MFPQGQAATIIIPIAIEGGGFTTNINKNVIKGSTIICETQPIITDFGFVYSVLKSSFLISIASENKIKARHILELLNRHCRHLFVLDLRMAYRNIIKMSSTP